MGLAVIQRHLDVDHRVPGEGALLHLGAHALLDRGDELTRYRATHNLINELESGAAFVRFHLDVADRILSMPAGLLDVTAMGRCRLDECLAQSGPNRVRGDVDAVAVLQPVHQEVLVGLTHRPQQQLLGTWRTLQLDGGILDHQSLQGTRKLVLVVAAGRADRDRQQGLRQQPRLNDARGHWVAQRVTGFCGAQLGDHHDLAGDRDLLRVQLDAVRCSQQPDPLLVVVVTLPVPAGELGPVPGDVHGGVRPQCAVEDTHHGKPAGVRVGGGANDLCEQRGIDGDLSGLHRVTLHSGDGRRLPAQRGGEAPVDDPEQFLGAHAAGGDRDHRVEAAVIERLHQVADDLFDGQFVAVEVALQELVVLGFGDDRLHILGAEVLDRRQLALVRVAPGAAAGRVVVHLAAQQRQVSDDLVLLSDERQVGGVDTGPENLLALLHGLFEACPFGVELGHHDRPRHAHAGAFVPQDLGGHVDAIGGADHEDGGVSGPQTGAQFTDIVGIARGIEEVDNGVTVGEGGQRERGQPLGIIFLATITGDPRLDQVLEQRGLARTG